MEHVEFSGIPFPGRLSPTPIRLGTSSVITASLPWQTTSGAQTFYGTIPHHYTRMAPKPPPEEFFEEAFVQMGNLRLHRIDPARVSPISQVGSGSFGQVQLASWEGALVALKELKITTAQDDHWKAFEREVKQLAELNHPRVICFYGISPDRATTRIVMEYCPGGTLRELLDNQEISWPEKEAFARDIALGLSYLHKNEMLHIDLAAENVLLDAQGRAKLADFGLAAKRIQGKLDLEDHPHNFRLAWNAPELFQKGAAALSWRTDIYCFGVVMWEIATQEVPKGRNSLERLTSLPADTPPHYRNVIQSTWNTDPTQRPTADEAFARLAGTVTGAATTSREPRQLCAALRQNSRLVAQAWQHRFHVELPYIPPHVSNHIGSQENLPALETIDSFLTGPAKVLLLLGDSGMGKSSLLAELVDRTSRTPILVSLPSLAHPEQNMMETLLQQQGCSTSEMASLRNEPLLLLLDGYDEITTDSNLYLTNRLDQWNVKVIITCRTERTSRMEGDYQQHFSPTNRQEFKQLVLQPFDKAQIEVYVQEYVLRFGSTLSGDWNKPELFFERLRTFKGLGHLTSNPFFLFLIISIFPQLAATDKKLTRQEIYAAFLKHWYEQQQARLVQQGLASPNTVLPFDDYTQALAVTMFRQGTQVACYQPQKTLFGQENQPKQEAILWAPFFDNRYHPYIPLLRAGCPLQASGNEWRFLHKSIWEYYVTRAILSSFALFNLRLLNDQLGIVGFLADYAWEKEAQGRLFAVIDRSRDDPGFAIAAANSMTLLTFAGVPFSNRDLHGVRIGGALCKGGVFDSTNLSGADLQGAQLQDAWLDYANLSGANLTDVNFGQLPYLQHDGAVNGVSYSPDGRLIAAATNPITIWDAAKGKKVKVIDEKLRPKLVTFSADGKYLASTAAEMTTSFTWDAKYVPPPEVIRVWETGSWREVCTLREETTVLSIAFSQNGKYLASAVHNTIRIWETLSWQRASLLEGHTKPVESAAFSPDGKLLATGSADNTVRIWETTAWRTIFTLHGHAGTVKSVAFSPDGALLTSATDKEAIIWETASGIASSTFRHHVGLVSRVTLSPDGKLLAGEKNKVVYTWEVSSPRTIFTFRGHTDLVWASSFSPDGKLLATGSSDKTVRIWKITSTAQSTTFEEKKGRSIIPLPGECCVKSLVFSPNGELLASASGRSIPLSKGNSPLPLLKSSGRVDIWETVSGRAISTLKGETGGTLSLAFSPNRTVLAGGSWDGMIRLWEVRSGQEISAVKGHNGPVHSVCFSPNGEILASGGTDQTLRLWEATSSREIFTRGPIHCVVFSPEGRLLATGGADMTVSIWETISGREISTFRTGDGAGFVQSLAFGPDGKVLAHGGSDDAVHLRETTSWREISTLKGQQSKESHPSRFTWNGPHCRVLSVAFSPNGSLLASASGRRLGLFSGLFEGEAIRVWETSSWREISAFGRNIADVETITCGPDGQQLASASEDGSVRLWQWNQVQGRFGLAWIRNGTNMLTANEANIEGAISPSHLELLQQHGAKKRKTSKTERVSSVEGEYVGGHQLHHYYFAKLTDAHALIEALQNSVPLPGNQQLNSKAGELWSKHEGQWLVKLNDRQRQHARQTFRHLLPREAGKAERTSSVQGRYVGGYQLHHYYFKQLTDALALIEALQDSIPLPGNQELKHKLYSGSKYRGPGEEEWLLKLNDQQRQHAQNTFPHLLPAGHKKSSIDRL
jgi:WD40 repeat protein/serine/threonine protein kinase